jgi:hypothetical protein
MNEANDLSREKSGSVEKWQWWAGFSEERYSDWFDCREDAVAWVHENCDEGGWITEAVKAPPQRLSDWFDAERFVEDCDERAYDNNMMDPDDGEPLFPYKPEQSVDLQATVRAAIDAWQDRHGLTFTPWAFERQRNTEYVTAAPQPQEDEG